MTAGEIVLMGREGGEDEERVRDCGSRGRIKVISINKGIKKAIYRVKRRKVENL